MELTETCPPVQFTLVKENQAPRWKGGRAKNWCLGLAAATTHLEGFLLQFQNLVTCTSSRWQGQTPALMNLLRIQGGLCQLHFSSALTQPMPGQPAHVTVKWQQSRVYLLGVEGAHSLVTDTAGKTKGSYGMKAQTCLSPSLLLFLCSLTWEDGVSYKAGRNSSPNPSQAGTVVKFPAAAMFGDRLLKPAAYDIFIRGAWTRALFQDAWMHLSSLALCVGQGCALLSESQNAGLYAEVPCVATLCPCGDPENCHSRHSTGNKTEAPVSIVCVRIWSQVSRTPKRGTSLLKATSV